MPWGQVTATDSRPPGNPPNDYMRDDTDPDSVPNGYVRVYRQSSEPARNGRRCRLLLPATLMEQMELEQQQATLALSNDETINKEQSGESPNGSVRPVSAAQSGLNHPEPERPTAANEPGNGSGPPSDLPPLPEQLGPLPKLPGGTLDRRSQAVRVMEQTELDRLMQPTKSADRQREARALELQKRLSDRGVWRHHLYPLCQHNAGWNRADDSAKAGEVSVTEHGSNVKQTQRAHILACFAPLDKAHPHFAEVTDAYRSSALAAVGENGPTSVMAPPPVLLLGVPGLGKTHYAKALANVLGLPFVSLAFDTGLSNSALLGSDKHWSNTHHGALFEHLCLGTVANPMVLLDEIDKAPADRASQQSPLAALHSCLEPVSSRQVKDISVEITFDASRVVWVATANDARLIPSTLLSRFAVYQVMPPVGANAYWLTQSLCETVLTRDGRGMSMPSSVIRLALAVFSPRQQRISLEMACRRAQADERTEFQVEDFPSDVQEEIWASANPVHLTQGAKPKARAIQKSKNQWNH